MAKEKDDEPVFPIEWNDAVVKPLEYVEKWRLLLWDKAFDELLADNAIPRFVKGSDLRKIAGGTTTLDRLIFRYLFQSIRWICMDSFIFTSHIQYFFCRYIKYELVPKGALKPEEIPDTYDDETVLAKLSTIFSDEQVARFDNAHLMTGAWFLECGNFVHREEKHLVPVPAADATGIANMEIDDNDEDFSILPGAPPPVAAVAAPPAPAAPAATAATAAPGKRSRPRAAKKRGKDAVVPAAPPQEEPQRQPPNGNANAGGNEPDVTQASDGALGNQDTRAALSTQVSTGGVTDNGSPPRSSNLDNISTQSPLRLPRSKVVSRSNLKLAATNSSAPEIPKLPMYLEVGNIVELISLTNSRKRMEPQLVDIVEHITKVS